MIKTHSSLILLCLTLATTATCTSHAQDLPRLPITRCDDLLTPLIGEQVLVFDSQTYEHIQNHSISQLARQLRDKNISLDFNVGGDFGGYYVQGRMLVRLFQELFPFQPFARSTNIKITLFDSAMHGQTPSPLSSFFEMPLLKNANPVIAPWSKVGVRTHLHIPMDAKIAAFYSDSHERFIDALSEIPSPPEIVILSTKFTTLTSESRSFLSRQFPTYKVMTLTEFQAQHNPPEPTEHYLLFNDTRHRMMEIYTASDYAVVIGSSNIFEPLQVHCPLIYFKNSVMGERYPTLQNNILGGYHAETWKLMGDIANQTRGAVGIIYFSDLPEAIHQIEKINPKDILHPAFVIPPGKNQSRFGDLLDQIEKLVREKLKIENTTEN